MEHLLAMDIAVEEITLTTNNAHFLSVAETTEGGSPLSSS